VDKATPFSQEKLNEIFKILPKNPERVISRESRNLEFKESFGWKSLPKYLKTCASFANTKGGYIVYGIANRPHKLIGLTGANLKLFEGIDPAKLAMYFNEHFSPEMIWDIQEYELSGRSYGLLYVHESQDKPVVCTKNAEQELKEGDIYYRYRGRSQRIKYPELRSILDYKRESEQRLWMRHLTQIAKIGVKDTGIFDLQTGQVTGTEGAFLIDESLLSQLSFIKEGEFFETKGRPTLKLIGSIKSIKGGLPIIGQKQIIRSKGIRIGDIVLAFLNNLKIDDPTEYIKQICFESTGFLPVYYFMHRSGFNKDKTIGLIEKVISRSQSKNKLLERLQEQKTQYLKLSLSNTPAAVKRRTYVEQAKKKGIPLDLGNQEINYCLKGLRTLTPEEVKRLSDYICDTLRTWFNKHYASGDGVLADNLRRTICWVDEALYMEGLE